MDHKIECPKREVEKQKAKIEDLKAELEKRAWIHELAIANFQSKDQIFASYQNKVKRCSHIVDVMLKKGLRKTW